MLIEQCSTTTHIALTAAAQGSTGLPQVQPPSYGIRLEGAAVVRETEGGRLQPLAAGEAPSSGAAPDPKPTPSSEQPTGGKVCPWQLPFADVVCCCNG